MQFGVVFSILLAVNMLPNPVRAECTVPEDPDPVIIASGFNWPHVGPNGTGAFAGLMKEAFCRIGRKAVVVKMPTARAILQAQAGMVFGDGPRRWSLAAQYGSLMLQQPALYDLKFYAFSIKPHSDIKTYSDLRSYRVGSVIGRKSVEASLTAVLEDFTLASTGSLAFRQLKAGRIDVVVLDEFAGLHFAKEAGIETIHGALLEMHPFHLLVHTSHQDVMPTLAKTLRQMQADGTSNMITEKYLIREGVTLIED